MTQEVSHDFSIEMRTKEIQKPAKKRVLGGSERNGTNSRKVLIGTALFTKERTSEWKKFHEEQWPLSCAINWTKMPIFEPSKGWFKIFFAFLKLSFWTFLASKKSYSKSEKRTIIYKSSSIQPYQELATKKFMTLIRKNQKTKKSLKQGKKKIARKG